MDSEFFVSEWHYVKDTPLPKDGRRVFLAYKDPRTGDRNVIFFYCLYCQETVVYDKPEEYYAWADFDIAPPAYPVEEDSND